jgi:glycosyltransferase involved in cell wall biosynthesis
VRDGENGLLVRWRSPQAFAERIDLLLSDDALRAQLQANARASIEQFDWRRIGDRVRDLYQQLAAESTSAVACSCF